MRPNRVGSRSVRGPRNNSHAAMLLVCLALGPAVLSSMLSVGAIHASAAGPCSSAPDPLQSDAYGGRSRLSYKEKAHEIPRSADRDPPPLVHWYHCIWDAQAADYRRPSSRSRRELAGSVEQRRPPPRPPDQARSGRTSDRFSSGTGGRCASRAAAATVPVLPEHVQPIDRCEWR